MTGMDIIADEMISEQIS